MIWFHILYKQSYNHGKPGITKLCLTTNKATYFHLSILQTWFNAIQNKTHSFLYLTWMVSVRFRCSVPLWLSNGFYRLQILGFASFHSIIKQLDGFGFRIPMSMPVCFRQNIKRVYYNMITIWLNFWSAFLQVCLPHPITSFTWSTYLSNKEEAKARNVKQYGK